MGKLYWNRAGHIAIEGNDGEMHSYGGTNGLDFKFSGEKVGDIYAQFECSILGLSGRTINELTVWNPAEAFTRQRKIQVFAGYEDGGIENPIFEGIIVEAIPTSPPEMWLNFKCLHLGDFTNIVSNPKQFKDTSLSQIFDEVGAELGLETFWTAWKVNPTTKGDFNLEGPLRTLAERFASQFNVTVYEEDGTLYCRDKRPQFDEPESIRDISLNTGMISIGKIDIAGATIRTRLDDSSKLFSWINLQSVIIPKANGLYVVIKKKHKGHLRGGEWFTELETIRQGAAV